MRMRMNAWLMGGKLCVAYLHKLLKKCLEHLKLITVTSQPHTYTRPSINPQQFRVEKCKTRRETHNKVTRVVSPRWNNSFLLAALSLSTLMLIWCYFDRQCIREQFLGDSSKVEAIIDVNHGNWRKNTRRLLLLFIRKPQKILLLPLKYHGF